MFESFKLSQVEYDEYLNEGRIKRKDNLMYIDGIKHKVLGYQVKGNYYNIVQLEE